MIAQSLVTQLGNAAVGVRQATAANLLTIIRERYVVRNTVCVRLYVCIIVMFQELSTTVIPSLSTELRGINISVLPDTWWVYGGVLSVLYNQSFCCSGAYGYLSNNSVNICRNVSTPDNVSMTGLCACVFVVCAYVCVYL